uniref:Ribosomal protein L10 n=1 Tax=Salix viminalis TaxID=40686 RepID=A0A6N2L035_SALVM
MASRYRSLSKPAFSLLKSTTNKPTLQPKSTPSLFPARPSLTFSRPVPQLGAIQSLLPFNSAVSSARLTSCLSIDSRSSRSYSQGMPFGRSLLQRESLYRVSGEERSPEILILFHSSGLTSNQWRKLKNLWFPGRTLFRPSCFGTGKKKRFFAQLAHSAGPTCILYLAEEASDRLEFLPSWDSMDQDLLLLYGQYRSTLVHHMDVEKLLI